MSLFVCGIHLDREVNFKGKGCDLCDAARDKRQEKKEFEKKKRAAWRNGEVLLEEDED